MVPLAKMLKKGIFSFVKEITNILAAYDRAFIQGKKAALAIVVHIEGSAYRKPGARMLITEDGELTGAISGGCLEGDALRRARLAIIHEKPVLVTYDTTDEDDAKLGVGLGCNGIIHILIEPIVTTNEINVINLLKRSVETREPSILITAFNIADRRSDQIGSCALIKGNDEIIGRFHSIDIQEAILEDIAMVRLNNRSVFKKYDSPMDMCCFIELLEPPLSLIIIGAGNDAIPLCNIAEELGFRITVIDGRANYLSRERFPKAHQLITARPEQILERIIVDKRTVFVLMTHNYNYDRAVLERLIPLEINYIGALGPRNRSLKMIEEIRNSGVIIDELQLKKVYGPAGLDLGAENAEEIALSIVSEIQSVTRQTAGGSLKVKSSIDRAFI